MWEAIRSADCKEERCIYSNRCVREGKVLACWLLICAVLQCKRRGVGGNSGFSLGSFCSFASLLVGFWVFGWLVSCLLCVFVVLCCCQCYYLLIIECQFTLLFVRLEGKAGKQKNVNICWSCIQQKFQNVFRQRTTDKQCIGIFGCIWKLAVLMLLGRYWKSCSVVEVKG